jgi:hypothetical protein
LEKRSGEGVGGGRVVAPLPLASFCAIASSTYLATKIGPNQEIVRIHRTKPNLSELISGETE